MTKLRMTKGLTQVLILAGAFLGIAAPAAAQSFRVQCPTSTITHPNTANNNSEPAYTGPTQFGATAPVNGQNGGYVTPTANVNCPGSRRLPSGTRLRSPRAPSTSHIKAPQRILTSGVATQPPRMVPPRGARHGLATHTQHHRHRFPLAIPKTGTLPGMGNHSTAAAPPTAKSTICTSSRRRTARFRSTPWSV